MENFLARIKLIAGYTVFAVDVYFCLKRVYRHHFKLKMCCVVASGELEDARV